MSTYKVFSRGRGAVAFSLFPGGTHVVGSGSGDGEDDRALHKGMANPRDLRSSRREAQVDAGVPGRQEPPVFALAAS